MTDPRQLERLVAETPVAQASPEARERARRAFLTGRAAARRIARWRAMAPLAAAAAAVGVLWLGQDSPADWVVLSTTDAELEDGTRLDSGRAFRSGTAITAGVSPLEAQLGSALRIHVPPGTRVALPPGPGRWFGRARLLHVETGEIFATSGGAPLEFDLVVDTPDTRTRILGTTFAVRRNHLGTCVCLYEGSLETLPQGQGAAVAVPTGRRVQFYSAGQPPTEEPLSDQEMAMLGALHREGLR